jgi:hypothetical protein
MGLPVVGLEFVPGGAINVLGALLVAAVGVGVFLVRPRTGRCTAFGIYLAAFGGAFALHNFGSRNVPMINTVLGSATALLLVIGGLAVFRVAWLTRASGHRPLPVRGRRAGGRRARNTHDGLGAHESGGGQP